MESYLIFTRFLVAVALGFVVGLQRENAASPEKSNILGGIRTFPVVSLLGCAFAYLGATINSSGPFIVGFAVVGMVLAGSQFVAARDGHIGLTTAMALLLVYAIGAICWAGNLILATAIAVVLTILLTMKMELHQFAHKLTQIDLISSLKFAVICAIVLPLLPDHSYGPPNFEIFNPFKIWLLVVFISGISFIGYILVKLVGPTRGIGITGLLGGLASSTALTLSFSNRSKNEPELSSSLATGIVVAWIVMYVRVLAIVWLISSELGRNLAIPMLVPVIPGLAWSLWLWRKQEQHVQKSSPRFSNPFELVPAIKFVGIILLVLVISKAARLQFGDSGLLVSSFVAGLADVDAIAVSVGQMMKMESMDFLKIGTISILLAGIANTITKGTIACLIGAPAMRRAIGPAVVLMVIAGAMSVMLVR
jgi:uncharacterized membrane protein (DUF4010 family)